MLNSNIKSQLSTDLFAMQWHTFETNELFFAYIESQYPGADMFVSERMNSETILCLHRGRCRLIYNNETEPSQIDDVFQLAKNAGNQSIGTEMLVDWRFFSGVVDWSYVSHRHDIAPNMSSQPCKVAYVMRDEAAELTAKAIILWLKDYDCQTFHNMSAAEAWLGWT